jgi:hypothetical protein
MNMIAYQENLTLYNFSPDARLFHRFNIQDQSKRHWDCLDEVEEARLMVVELPIDGVVFDGRTGEVRGLVDYGSAMWADPVFSDCFVQASEDFMEGYGSVHGEGARPRRLL